MRSMLCMVVLLAACSKAEPTTTKVVSPEPKPSPPPEVVAPPKQVPKRDKQEFYNVVFEVPAGTTFAHTGNALPGPEPRHELGDPPPPPPHVHPGLSANGIGVEVWKDPAPSKLAGMKQSISQNKEFVKVDEEQERPDGYDFTYSWRAADGTVSQVVHRYYEFGKDEYYTCKYYSSFGNMQESELVCRSLRKK